MMGLRHKKEGRWWNLLLLFSLRVLQAQGTLIIYYFRRKCDSKQVWSAWKWRMPKYTKLSVHFEWGIFSARWIGCITKKFGYEMVQVPNNISNFLLACEEKVIRAIKNWNCIFRDGLNKNHTLNWYSIPSEIFLVLYQVQSVKDRNKKNSFQSVTYSRFILKNSIISVNRKKS